MNPSLNITDYAAISPLLILLFGALCILLVESFTPRLAKKLAGITSTIVIVAAFFALLIAPQSTNPLLTSWLRFDSLARLFSVLFLCVGGASSLLAKAYFKRNVAPHGEYFFLLLASLFGLLLIGSSADFLTLFLGLETLSISLYILCGYMKSHELSHEGAIKYFLMGALAAAFLIYGIALLYGALGTTRFDLLFASYQKPDVDMALFLGGISLITLGLLFKAAVVPFHSWAPDVYESAPTPVTAFMSVGTKIGAYAALIIVFLVSLPDFDYRFGLGIACLSALTLIYANFVALRQTELRKFFAYSGISHSGFLLIPLASSGPNAVSSIVFYLIVYGFATMGAFSVFAFIDGGDERLPFTKLNGLFRRSPLLAGALSLCLLTLAGIPPTAGFLAKFYIFKVGLEAGLYWLVVIALLTTILSAYYYLRLIALMLSQAPEDNKAPKSLWQACIVAVICISAIFYLSISPAPLMTLLE